MARATQKRDARSAGLLGKPFLRGLRADFAETNAEEYPFNIPALRGGISLDFETAVTFFVGENGSGKSTILEAIAVKSGFNPQGGNRDHCFGGTSDISTLASRLRLEWLPKVTEGFFLRAETFFNFASFIDEVVDGNTKGFRAYGGKSLTAQSHGESFLALFANRFKRGLYVLDEPEAALSPQRQLSFLKIIHDLAQAGAAQFLIATHSPMLLAYPDATIFSMDADGIERVKYQDTQHYVLTKQFLDCPERYFKYLFGEEPE